MADPNNCWQTPVMMMIMMIDDAHLCLPSLLLQLLKLDSHLFSRWLRLHVLFHHVGPLWDCWLKLNGQLVIVSLTTWWQHSHVCTQHHCHTCAQYLNYNFNSLPSHITVARSLSIFCSRLKSHLFSLSYPFLTLLSSVQWLRSDSSFWTL